MSYDELLGEDFDAVEIVAVGAKGLRWVVQCQDCVLTRTGWTSDPKDNKDCFFTTALDAASFYQARCVQENEPSEFNLELALLYARVRKHFDSAECLEIMANAEKRVFRSKGRRRHLSQNPEASQRRRA